MNLAVIEKEIFEFETFILNSEAETRGYRPTDVVFRGLLPAEKLSVISEKRFALIVEGMLDLLKLVQIQLNGYRQPQAVLRFKFAEEKGWLKNQKVWKDFWCIRINLGRESNLFEITGLKEIESETQHFINELKAFILKSHT